MNIVHDIAVSTWKADRKRVTELFHKLWGKARGDLDHRPPEYNKKEWQELKKLLNKQGVSV